MIQPELNPRSGELASTELAPALNMKLEKLGYAVARSDHAPTRQSRELFADLAARAEAQLRQLSAFLSDDIGQFNQRFADLGIPAIVV